MSKFSWRRAVAVPAALSLALGGVLLSATAATAADGQLVVTSPTEGSTTETRDVSIVGSAAPGAVINVFTDDTRSERLVQTAADRNSGAFTAVLPTYADDAPVAQSVFIDGLVGLSGFDDPQTLSFNLPAVQSFSVTAPTPNQQLSSRDVTFSGTGTDGSTVNVLTTDGDRLVGPAVVQNGVWTLQYTYDEFADRQQTVRVTQVTGGSGSGDVTVTFNLTTGQTLTVDTPAEGSTTETRTVEFSGTGNAGSLVNVLAEDGSRLTGQARVGDDGTWSATVVYDDDAPIEQTARVTQVTGASGSGDITRTFNLPAVVVPPTDPEIVLDTPVVTSPSEGEVVVGDQVTFEGTGTPESNIVLTVVPTDAVDEIVADDVTTLAEPADPTDPIVVDADGTWSVTLALQPDDYTVGAVAVLLNDDGTPVVDENGAPVVSAPSDDVQFSLVAAAAPAGDGATPIAATPAGLAETGVDGAGASIALAGAVLLLGSVLMVLARRRQQGAANSVSVE